MKKDNLELAKEINEIANMLSTQMRKFASAKRNLTKDLDKIKKICDNVCSNN